MSDEIQKVRSPNSPKFDLNQAIELVRTLHGKIGRSPVKAEIAVGALGYNGLNGAALGTLGAISQYGLVDRTEGNVQITPLTLKILHPTDEAQKNAAMKEAALNPKVFADIYANWNDMSEDVLANHLIHQRFTSDAAKRAASVYKLNSQIANLSGRVNDIPKIDVINPPAATSTEVPKPAAPINTQIQTPPPVVKPNMLAAFRIPIGSAEAELIFTGDKLEPEDFDALADYVGLFKKQYQRKLDSKKATEPQSAVDAKVLGTDLTTIKSL